MRLIRWSVDHLAPVCLFYAVLVVASVATILNGIPLRLAPAIESPLIAVTTEVMGLSPEEMEARVTTPLEHRLAGIGGVSFVRSTSMRGMSIITLELPYHADMAAAMRDVSAIVAAEAATLRIGERTVHGPWVRRVDPLDIPVLRVAVRAPSWGSEAVRDVLDTTVRTRLARVPGVRDVWTFGVAAPPLQVMVDSAALAAHGLSAVDVQRALDAAGRAHGAGTLVDPLGRETWVLSSASPQTAADVASVRIATRGGSIRLGDVASVETAPAREGPRYRYNGQPAVELCVTQQPEASSPTTIARVRDVLAQVQRANPGLTFEEAYDNAHFVEIVARGVWLELGLAIMLTGLVVYLFLGEVRATLIALATVPASLACAVLGFAPLGLSLNSSTLVGLLLAIGRLVDDTIIDLHAVQRHRHMGKSARDAAIDGCSEVRRAVIGATVVVCLAMLPLTFTGGLTQDMFVGIVWPFLLALAASLAVALTLTPALVAWAWRDLPPDTGRSPIEGLLTGAETGYRRLITLALRHRALVLSAAFGACYLAALMTPLVGSEMMPLSDTGQLYCVLEARPGTSVDETARLAARLEALLLRRPEVVKVSTEIGDAQEGQSLTGYARHGTSTATMWVTLTDKDARSATIWDVADAVWDEAMAAMPELRRLSLKEMGSDVMASSMAPVELVIHGPDLPRLSVLAEQTRLLADRLGGAQARADRDQGLRQTATSWGMQQPAIAVRLDDAALAREGGVASDVLAQVEVATGGASQTAMRNGPPVMVMTSEGSRRSADTLARLPIVTSHESAGAVPLGRLARFETVTAPDVIEHEGLRRCISVMGSYRNGGPGSMQLGMDLLMASRMQVGFPAGYDIEQRGDMVQMMDAFERLLKGLAIALGLMYAALAVQLRSLLLPLVVMAAIPLELPGVLVVLVAAHQTFSTVSLLGLVVLNGMDVTASILVIDAVLQWRQTPGNAARPLAEAIAQAAPQRLRPVLMTVFVTLVVMAPTAFFPRTGMDAYTPLAIVVAGGLSMSTVLTLGVVPVLLDLTEKRHEKADSTGKTRPSGQSA